MARIVAPGMPHHISQRGNRRLQTFFSDKKIPEERLLELKKRLSSALLLGHLQLIIWIFHPYYIPNLSILTFQKNFVLMISSFMYT